MKHQKALRKRRLIQRENYSLRLDLPEKFVVRKTKSLFFAIVIIVAIAAFFLFKALRTEEALHQTLRVYLLAVILFGLWVKWLLSYFLPEMTFTGGGLRFRGRRLIAWDQVEGIQVEETSYKILIRVDFINGKHITEKLSGLNVSSEQLQYYLSRYLKKFGNRKVRLIKFENSIIK